MEIKKAGWPSFLMTCIMVYDIISEKNSKFRMSYHIGNSMSKIRDCMIVLEGFVG